MIKFKLSSVRHLFDKIQDGKILIGIHYNSDGNEDMLFSFYRSFKDNKVYYYQNIFSTKCVEDDDDELGWMDEEWDINSLNVRTEFVNYDMFLAWQRQTIINQFKYHYNHPNEDINFFLIKKELEKDGGKIVTFSHTSNVEDCGLLIGVTSTDEDYYYQYLDKDFKIQNMTCVGGYKVLKNNEIPHELVHLTRFMSKKKTKEVLDNIMSKFLQDAEVFFTPIYLRGISKDDLTLFRQYSLLYLPKK